jgi:hypothetical protein
VQYGGYRVHHSKLSRKKLLLIRLPRAIQTVGAKVTSHLSAPTVVPGKQGSPVADDESDSDAIVAGGIDVCAIEPGARMPEVPGANGFLKEPCHQVAVATIHDRQRSDHNAKGRYSNFSVH